MSRPPQWAFVDGDWRDLSYAEYEPLWSADDEASPTDEPSESMTAWPWTRDPDRKDVYTLETPSGRLTAGGKVTTAAIPPALPDTCAWCQKDVDPNHVHVRQVDDRGTTVWIAEHDCGWNVYDGEDLANFIRYA